MVIESTRDGVVIRIRAIPRGSKSRVGGTRDGALLVRLQAAPVDGAANAELIEVLATALGVPKRAISLVTGERSRDKRVHVSGIDRATAQEQLVPSERG